MAELSPMMKQYFKIKEQNPGSILFFRLGDFYEMFYDDAKLASRELDLTLTGRDCGQDERAPMCGVPYHAVDVYVQKLIEKGYKVAICEQLTDPALSKGLVERDVVRIITPGIPDKWYVHAVTRANYEVLTEAGVRIFEYKPGFIHSKVCLSDNRYAVVGTVNMDFRSLYLHFEDAVYLYGSPAVRQVAADFEETFPVCREMTYARCRHVHFYQRVIRTLLQVFSPLL